MPMQTSLIRKRKQYIHVKYDQLKIESDIAISCVQKILDEGKLLLAELENSDHVKFLQNFSSVNRKLDKLVKKVIQLNCNLELECSSEDEMEEDTPRKDNQTQFTPNTAGNELQTHTNSLTVPNGIQVGDILDMCYLQGDSPNNFWLQHYCRKTLHKITEMLIHRFNSESLKACKKPYVGMYVCVCNSQECFRAKVLEILKEHPIEILVLNIDKAEIKEVPIQNVYYLDEELASIGVQCVNCSLPGNFGDMSIWNDTVAKVFADILRDSNLVVTVNALLPQETCKFVVEVDCHNERRLISKIDLSEWLKSEVFPLLHKVKNNLVNAEAVMELYRFLDPVCTEEVKQPSTPELCTQSKTEKEKHVHKKKSPSAKKGNDKNLCQETLLKTISPVTVPLCQETLFKTTAPVMVPHYQETLLKTTSPVTVPLCQETLFKNTASVTVPFCQEKFKTTAPFTVPLCQETFKTTAPVTVPLCQETLLKTTAPVTVPLCQETLLKTTAPVMVPFENVALRCTNLAFGSINIYDQENEQEPCGPEPLIKQLEKCDFFLSHRNLQGLYFDVILAHIEDPGEFYVHVVCLENSEIDNLSKNMNEFYNKFNIPFKTKSEARKYIGSFCAVCCVDYGGWYRGEILDWNDHLGTSVLVKFVDYGEKSNVPLNMIQPLRREYTVSPIFAHCCSLANIRPVISAPQQLLMKWSLESISLFKCLVDENTVYTIHITEANQNVSPLPVILYNNSGDVCINKSMVDYEYAVSFSTFEVPIDFKILNTPGDYSEVNEDNEMVPGSEVLGVWDPMSEDYYSETNNLYHDDEDATYAVTGYKPQDDKRICKIFATHGRCFKGETCLKEHSFPHRDGWTTDKDEIYNEAFNVLILPGNGSNVTVQITEIVNVNMFWAIINNDTISDDEQEETLMTLSKYLNQQNNVKALKRLVILPAIGQIVVARYTAGRYYRARVLDFAENCVEVVFVDYGKKDWITLSNIYDIEQKYLHLPFQAVECMLANVECIEDDVEGVNVFKSLLNGSSIVNGKVVNSYIHAARMEVLLRNNEGHDIGDKIIEKGHGRPRNYVTLAGHVNYLPS